MAWWWIPVPIQNKWMISTMSYFFGEDVGTILFVSDASTTPSWHCMSSRCEIRFWPKSKIYQTKVVIMAWWWIPVPIHNTLMISNMLYISGEDEGTNHSVWVWGLNHWNSSQCCDPWWIRPTRPNFWANQCGGGVMMVDIDVHPQLMHMNVLNHLEYVWSGCWTHFT